MGNAYGGIISNIEQLAGIFNPPTTGRLATALSCRSKIFDMILPEAIETTRIHRVAGRTGDCTAFVTTPGGVSLADYGLLCVNKGLACLRHARRLALTPGSPLGPPCPHHLSAPWTNVPP
jgi:hypothetical protein